MLDINPSKTQSEQEEIPQSEDKENVVYQSTMNQPNQVGNIGVGAKTQRAPKNVFFEPEEESTKLIGIFTIIVLVIVLIASAGLYFLQTRKGSQLAFKERTAEELKIQLAKPELKDIDEQATRYNSGLKKLNSFINQTPDYAKLLKRLQEITPNEITLTNFSFDNKNLVKISGQAPDLAMLTEFLQSVEKTSEFSQVELTKNQKTTQVEEQKEYFSFDISASLEIDQSNKNKDLQDSEINAESNTE